MAARPAQERLVHLVARTPGQHLLYYADRLGPSRQYAYRTIWRAITNGLCRVTAGARRGWYRLHVA